MTTTLIIDTSAINIVTITLIRNTIRYQKVRESRILKSQTVLPLIEELLKEHELSMSDITAIEVNTGPGSFTGLRVGATVANTLGYLLNIPVNGKKGLVNPTY